ncbi:heavy-metal-associated domain-containing protein [Microscilla marina]|uniref:MerP, putative n=1 Tax=Microscilla marina ATCC 23134 TaxID=313606 RepID=A1ZRF3_MICM2|nr:cation transporter [Microscilla marina]EAY27043.1 MerP, putative [Microscilla marina ATCC 23134]
MKNNKLIWLSFIFVLGFVVQAQAQKTKKRKKVATLSIKTSAQCGMCKDRIEKAMAYERGVKKAVLDVESKMLTVTYKTRKTNPDKLRKAVSNVGYDADKVIAEQKAYNKLPACCQKGGHDN